MEYQALNINIEYCRASSAKRMVNYIIDAVFFYIVVVFLAIAIETLSPGCISEMGDNPLLNQVASICCYGLVMFVIEAAFQGKSLGKLITKTRAVTNNGDTLSFKQFLIRNFIRAIPFNALSGLGNPCSPWHDTWSETVVVDEKKLDLEKRRDEFYVGLKNQTL